ncbi:MAG: peptidoglycan-binding protein [Methylococcales bacterium]|nr:peptidoglycan-binding protein [Methylococcales bacterium]
MSRQHQEGLAHLLYGINQSGGFVVLTGEVGTGKTLLSQCLLRQVPPNIFLALILNPKLSANELLANICDELHISYDKNNLTLKGLTDSLNSYLLSAHAEGKKTIVLIDEAQNLSADVLEQIRLLTNLETTKTKLLQIILLGQPELKKILDKPELRQLNQRITARYHLSSLSYPETEKYIKHRLNICGGHDDIFNRAAIKKIYEASKGTPRLINVICDRALLGAYGDNQQIVTAKMINNAAKEIFNYPVSARKRGLLGIIVKSLVICAFVFSLFYLINNQLKKTQFKLSNPLSFLFDEESNKKHITAPENKTKQQASAALMNEEGFEFYLKKKKLPVNSSLSQLAGLWGKSISPDTGCKEIKTEGLLCLSGQSSWEELVKLNRPVIMAFPVTKTEKGYVLLLGLKDGNPIFQFDKDLTFPIEQVLQLWKGHYLTLWQSPVQGINSAYPGSTSKSVKWIKDKISLNNPGVLTLPYSNVFDKALKAEVIKFQKQHGLKPDGIVGAKTFIYLQNNDPQDKSPKLGRKVKGSISLEKKSEDKAQQQMPIALVKTEKTVLDFESYLKKHPSPIKPSLSVLAELWGKSISDDAGCKGIKAEGLRCLFDQSSWKELIKLNRPVIMVFPITKAEKGHVLLLGIKDGDPIFQFDKKMIFPIEQVLNLWEGHYVTLWQSPVQGVKAAFPGRTSKSVKWIKEKISINNPGMVASLHSNVFDKALKKEVIAFQKQHDIEPDGIVGAKTFIYLQNNDPKDKSPKLGGIETKAQPIKVNSFASLEKKSDDKAQQPTSVALVKKAQPIKVNSFASLEKKSDDKAQQPTSVALVKKEKTALDFESYLKKHPLPIKPSLSKLAGLWDKSISADAGCKGIKIEGLRCLFDQSNWEELIKLNRPVIMTFPISKAKKEHALLLGINKGDPIFQFDKDMTFPIEQVLNLWEGHYVTLWESPVQGVKAAFPGRTSKSVKWIKKKISINNPNMFATPHSNVFDKALKKEVIAFQKQYDIEPDGIVGAKTFIYLQNNDPKDKSPKLGGIETKTQPIKVNSFASLEEMSEDKAQQQTFVALVKKEKTPLDFESYLKKQQLPLTSGLSQLASLWDKSISEDAGCKGIKAQGLHCLFDRSNWEELVKLNRPAMMEFSLSETEKENVILVGVKNGDPVFQFDKDITFPRDQVLNYWKGYYVALWQSPLDDKRTAFPGKSSKSVKWIKERISLINPGALALPHSDFFDKALKKEVMAFQKQHDLKSDGIVGSKSFIYLQNNDPQDNSPKLWQDKAKKQSLMAKIPISLEKKAEGETQKPVPVALVKEEKTPLDFEFYLKKHSATVKPGLSQLARLWDKSIPDDVGCKGIKAEGLHCLFDQSSWEELVKLDRPAMMGFSISETEKKNIILVGVKNGNPIFQFDKEMMFPIDKVLQLWKGHYVTLWQSPVRNSKTVFPGGSSRSVKWIKDKISLINPGALDTPHSNVFDEGLKKEIIKFQKQHDLKPDGIVSAKTFIYFQNNDPQDNSPKLGREKAKKQSIIAKMPIPLEKKTEDKTQLEKKATEETQQQTPVVLVKEEKEPLDFKFHLKEHPLPIKLGLSHLARLWDKSIPDDVGCKGVKAEGLHCLFDQSSWEELIKLDRPAILEFPITKTEKEHALLLGIKNGDPVFQFDKDMTFPVDKILKLWKGNYVTLWESPIHNKKTIFPGRTSKSVKWIKEKISLTNPDVLLSTPYSDFFDDELKKEVIKFQKQYNLKPDGIVGAKTFIYFQNNDPQDNSPKLGVDKPKIKAIKEKALVSLEKKTEQQVLVTVVKEKKAPEVFDFFKLPVSLEEKAKNKTPQQVPVTVVKENKAPVDIKLYLKEHSVPLKPGLSLLAYLWDKSISDDAGCKGIKSEGLHCLFDQASWEELVKLDRPVIMEFPVNEAEKEYALLLGVKNSDPVFQFDKEIIFPLDKVLKLWKGNYVVLWKSPIPNKKTVFPGRSSESVKWIKKKISLINPNVLALPHSNIFNETLKEEVIKFQKQYDLKSDGIVGAKTFIYLQNNDPLDNSPKLRREK